MEKLINSLKNWIKYEKTIFQLHNQQKYRIMKTVDTRFK